MTVEIESVAGEIITVTEFKELCFTQTAGVACDSLWAYFYTDSEAFEISRVRAYNGKELIFNGYCDCQKSKNSADGCENYFYARSAACLLVDNEAEPVTYESPTAKQLCFCNAEQFGFKTALPDICCNMKYEVPKGTSCFGAINQFVLLFTGSNICISPENEIVLQTISNGIKSIDKNRVISSVYTINRSEPYSQILFKKDYSSPKYSMHTKSRLADEVDIKRITYINLSSLPKWQRDGIVMQKLKASFADYRVLEIKAYGFVNERLLQRFSYGNYTDYALTEKRYICDKYGEYTRLTLKKMVDVKEITYVD